MKNFRKKSWWKCVSSIFWVYIRISRIPFITRYKGNPWNPYINSKNARNTFSPTFFSKIFHLKNCFRKIFEHLCRCKICPSFILAQLENQPNKLKMRKTRCEKKFLFFVLFTVRPRPGRTRFVNLLYSTVFSGLSRTDDLS